MNLSRNKKYLSGINIFSVRNRTKSCVTHRGRVAKKYKIHQKNLEHPAKVLINPLSGIPTEKMVTPQN